MTYRLYIIGQWSYTVRDTIDELFDFDLYETKFAFSMVHIKRAFYGNYIIY